MYVCVAEVERIVRRLGEINRTPLDQIIWLDNQGNPIPCSPEVLDRFEFMGLSNKDFIEFCFDGSGFSLEFECEHS